MTHHHCFITMSLQQFTAHFRIFTEHRQLMEGRRCVAACSAPLVGEASRSRGGRPPPGAGTGRTPAGHRDGRRSRRPTAMTAIHLKFRAGRGPGVT